MCLVKFFDFCGICRINSKKTNKTIIQDVLEPSDDDNIDDSTDSEITDDTEIPQYVSLTINFGEPQNSSARSMARTAIGTFEEIEALYVNAQRQGKNSFLYISPGRPLTKLNDGSWTGTLDGFIVNENYTFSISAMNLSGVLIFTGLTAYDTQRIKEEYHEHDDATTAGKKALFGALRLYLDFVNLFIMLLHFFGNRE